jgi:hypothetical protein
MQDGSSKKTLINKGMMSPAMKRLLWLAILGFLVGFGGFIAIYLLFIA